MGAIYGFIRLAENSPLEQEFLCFYEKFLIKYPKSLRKKILRRDVIYSVEDKKKFKGFSCYVDSRVALKPKEFNEFFECVEECSECHRSKCLQKKDIALKISKLKNDFNEITYFEASPLQSIAWVVSSEFRAILESLDCHVRFQKIIDRDSQLIATDFFQLHIDDVYPKIQPPTHIGYDRRCSKCHKYRKIGIGAAFCINEVEMFFPHTETIPDIGRTIEQIGEQTYLNESRSTIIISQRLYRIIKERKIKKLNPVYPVHFKF